MSKVSSKLPRQIKSWIKVGRARIFEIARSERYALPALNGLDKAMLDILPASGTFLEIGANDGYSQSNTFYLERSRGWIGILIEPIPSLYGICKRHRTQSACFNLACVGPGGPPTITLADKGLMTVSLGLLPADEETRRKDGSDSEVVVDAVQLSDVIDRAPIDSITFMSIDVEGAELHVLAGLDLTRHAPEYLLVETQDLSAVQEIVSPTLRLEKSLSHHDYLFVKAT